MVRLPSAVTHFVQLPSIRRASLLLLAMAVVVALASTASAEPILSFNVRITSGSFVVLPGECCGPPETGPQGGGSLHGDGVNVTASGLAFLGVGCQLGCAPGTPVGFRVTSNLASGAVDAPGEPRIEFDQFGFGGVIGGGSLDFLPAHGFTLPQLNGGPVVLRTPFTLIGGLGVPGFVPGPVAPEDNPVPARLVFNFSGAGTATGTFSSRHENGSDLFFFDNLRFDFSNTAATPEPGSLMLLGVGLGALALRRRTRCARS